jgi:hypothetical protein
MRQTISTATLSLIPLVLLGCGLLLPPTQQSRPSYQPLAQSQTSVRTQPSSQVIFSRTYFPSVRSPEGATTQGQLVMGGRLVSGGGAGQSLEYDFSGTSQVSDGRLTLTFSFVQIGQLSHIRSSGPGHLVFFRPVGLALDLCASPSHSVEVNWDRASIIGPDGTAHRVLHKGQRYSERDKPTPPSLIPPGTRIQDFVFPSDRIEYDLRTWNHGQFFEVVNSGQEFGLFLPIKSDGVETSYHVTFKVQ